MLGQPSLTIGVTLQEQNIQFQSSFHIEEQAAAKKYLGENHEPRLLFALSEAPLFYFSTSLGLSSIYESVNDFIPQQQLDMVSQELTQMVGMSLSELIDLLSGDLGIAVNGSIDTKNLNPDGFENIDVSFHIGIQDQKRAQSLIDSLVNMQMVPMQKDGNLVHIQTPIGKRVTIAVTEKDILFSTQKEVIDNMKANKKDSPIPLPGKGSVFSLDMDILRYAFLMDSMNQSTPGFEGVWENPFGLEEAMDMYDSFVEMPLYSKEYNEKKKEIYELKKERRTDVSALRKQKKQKLDALQEALTKLQTPTRRTKKSRCCGN